MLGSFTTYNLQKCLEEDHGTVDLSTLPPLEVLNLPFSNGFIKTKQGSKTGKKIIQMNKDLVSTVTFIKE